MQNMRDLLRQSLARSLEAMSPVDRLAAAWMVACGSALGSRAQVTGYDAGHVRIEVEEGAWLDQMQTMRPMLTRELGRIAGIPVSKIHFMLRKQAR
jgi:hypothetical protein